LKFLQKLYCYTFWSGRKGDDAVDEFGGVDVEGRRLGAEPCSESERKV